MDQKLLSVPDKVLPTSYLNVYNHTSTCFVVQNSLVSLPVDSGRNTGPAAAIRSTIYTVSTKKTVPLDNVR